MNLKKSKYPVVDNTYEVPIDLIKPQQKLNTDLFDIMPADKMNELKLSIDTYGQDHPIIVNQNMEIVAGENRFATAKARDAKTVIVRQMFFGTKCDELEFQERDNVVRRQFTRSDLRTAAERFIKKYEEISGKKIKQVLLSKTFGFSLSTANTIIQTERMKEESKLKSVKRTATQQKLDTISKRNKNTLNEMRRCPKDVIRKVRLMTEKQVKDLKKLEADSI